MKFSETTIDLILDIKEYSGGKLKNEFEISALIEFTHNKNTDATFTDIIFKAKFLKGLSKVMKLSYESEENSKKFMTEYTNELKELIDLIKIGLQKSDPILINLFIQKYFELSQESYINMNSLIEDLSVCKDYFNDIKNNQ